MAGRALKKITRSGVSTAGQYVGAASVAVGVGLLAGVAWALVAAGAALIVFGVAAEVS